MPSRNSLSERQSEVLRLIAEGRCLKEIAAHLGISYSTAAEHRAKLMAKLHISEVAGLVRFEFERNPALLHVESTPD
jgi:DNA-binding NarL/FixJ family response regulator